MRHQSRVLGDALATALAGFLGPDHELIRMWDEAKRHGEAASASANGVAGPRLVPETMAEMRHMQCPECGRVSSVPEWCERPVCVHAWDSCSPEIWDGNDEGALLEQSSNEEWRTPGPRTWTEMVPLALPRQREDRNG